MSIPTSDAAHAAWSRLYSTRKVKLNPGDPEPFKPERWLGKGGFSDVYSTDLGNGAIVALKRVNFRNSPRERPFYVNEMNILEKLSGKRHHHVVELIGCYELPRGSNSQIGLLVWPVAHCDLARFLGFMDSVVKLELSLIPTVPETQEESLRTLKPDEREAIEEVLDVTRPDWRNFDDIPQATWHYVVHELMFAKQRLCTVFGCLAKAIAYLHDDQKIRHKDLKPSQVLISPHGLWLTDFGWSMDISELSNSATNNGDTISPRYHAPERASMGQYCGRPEDIFALGCIYLEIAYRICSVSDSADLLNPRRERGWSYQANLDQKETWLSPLEKYDKADPGFPRSLRYLISQMLDRDADKRPLISKVVEVLRSDVSGSNWWEAMYFGSCCSH